MKITMNVKIEKLKIFQDFVKQFNFRFIGNPMIFNDYATVSVDGSHLDMKICNEFNTSWERLNREIKEVQEKNKIQKFIKKIRKIF